MTTSWVERQLSFTLRLADQGGGAAQPATFAGSGGSQTITLRGHRASVRVRNAGGFAQSTAEISIWGLTPSLLNQLSTLGLRIDELGRNTISVSAGDPVSGLSLVFVGTIFNAVPDFQQMPMSPMRMQCMAGVFENVVPFLSTTNSGKVQVSTLLSGIANRMAWGFENNGVDVALTNPAYDGPAIEQVRAICNDARINFALVPGGGSTGDPGTLLTIWPLFSNRSTLTSTPLIGPRPFGQMIGYPCYTPEGIIVETIFDPRLALGGQIQLQTSLPQASKSGIWNIYKLDQELDAQLPNGEWKSVIYCYNPGTQFGAPQPPA